MPYIHMLSLLLSPPLPLSPRGPHCIGAYKRNYQALDWAAVVDTLNAT